MSRIQQRSGKHGQKMAASYLSGLGIEDIEEIGTPVIITPAKVGGSSRRNVYHVIYGAKVSGDHRGVLPDGSSVLIETKTVNENTLGWSQMRPHQPDRLSRHAKHGGAVSLLVWVNHPDIFVMRWMPDGIAGFMPGKGISRERAKALHEETLSYLRSRIEESHDQ